MSKKVTIRKYPRNRDYYQVRGGGFPEVLVLTKRDANEVASARRRVIKKHLERMKKL